jgi:hypothetical protein
MVHHALLCEADAFTEEVTTQYIVPSCEVYRATYDQLLLEHVSELHAVAHRSPAPGYTERVLLVQCNRMTLESQNAILKLLEEPPVSTRFVFVMPSIAAILPTVRSRCALVLAAGAPGPSDVPELLQSDVATALTMIEMRLKKKDAVWVAETKTALLTWLTARTTTMSAADRARLVSAATLLATRGASNKFLLEDIVLTWAGGSSTRSAVVYS